MPGNMRQLSTAQRLAEQLDPDYHAARALGLEYCPTGEGLDKRPEGKPGALHGPAPRSPPMQRTPPAAVRVEAPPARTGATVGHAATPAGGGGPQLGPLGITFGGAPNYAASTPRAVAQAQAGQPAPAHPASPTDAPAHPASPVPEDAAAGGGPLGGAAGAELPDDPYTEGDYSDPYADAYTSGMADYGTPEYAPPPDYGAPAYAPPPVPPAAPKPEEPPAPPKSSPALVIIPIVLTALGVAAQLIRF